MSYKNNFKVFNISYLHYVEKSLNYKRNERVAIFLSNPLTDIQVSKFLLLLFVYTQQAQLVPEPGRSPTL